jgi:predicted nucleic acid-binding protein
MADQSVVGAFLRHVVDRPKLVPDAHLAALAIEHGVTPVASERNAARGACG